MTKYVEGDFDLDLHGRLTICTAAMAALILYTICWQKRLRETVKTSDDLTTQQAYGVVDKVTNLGSRCIDDACTNGLRWLAHAREDDH